MCEVSKRLRVASRALALVVVAHSRRACRIRFAGNRVAPAVVSACITVVHGWCRRGWHCGCVRASLERANSVFEADDLAFDAGYSPLYCRHSRAKANVRRVDLAVVAREYGAVFLDAALRIVCGFRVGTNGKGCT